MTGKKRSVAILGCAGIISGILTLYPPLPRDFQHNWEGYAGVIFGIILAIFLWVFHYPRSIARAIAVVVSSTVAYYAAMLSTVFAYMWMPHLFNSPTKGTNPPSYVMFVGGG